MAINYLKEVINEKVVDLSYLKRMEYYEDKKDGGGVTYKAGLANTFP